MSASIPRSDYTAFPPEFLCLPIPATFSDPTIEQTLNMFNNYSTMTAPPPFMISSDINSPVSVASFPDQFGVPDGGSLAALYDFAGCNYRNQPGEDCSGLMTVAESWPTNYDMVADNIWVQLMVQGAQDSKQVAKVEDSEVKVGRYSVEERKHRILRYLKKRNQRNFNKTIKYACRKTLADKRVRIRGRFAKNNEACEDIHDHQNYNVMNTSENSYQQNNSSLIYVQDESSQMMYGDDEWLQAAMGGGLVYLPYSSG